MEVANSKSDPDGLFAIGAVNNEKGLAGSLHGQIPLGSDPQCLAGLDLNTRGKRNADLTAARSGKTAAHPAALLPRERESIGLFASQILRADLLGQRVHDDRRPWRKYSH